MTYASAAQAREYHAARLTSAAWSALSDEQQKAALQSATDALDSFAAGHGAWQKAWTPETLPGAITQACCMLALDLSDQTLQERIRAQQQGVSATSMGSASESYSGLGASTWALISPAIALKIGPYLRRTGGGAVIL